MTKLKLNTRKAKLTNLIRNAKSALNILAKDPSAADFQTKYKAIREKIAQSKAELKEIERELLQVELEALDGL